ncbi:AroM family protein [Nesterenkonia muleiensis]|uniref:AroM family protein n=1 Tax=Nesterenkonia muleiensis TaxID=2282648 RepID=UPI000E743B4B|nr:AroM family protein [Nesterenkonia muleiensis]
MKEKIDLVDASKIREVIKFSLTNKISYENPRMGIISVGQTPRVSMMSELRSLLPGIQLIERGALDDTSEDEIYSSKAVGDAPGLVTKLRSGESVVVSKALVSSRTTIAVQKLEVEDKCDAILIACTGEFSEIPHSKPLIVSGHAVYYTVRELAEKYNRVSIICPLPEQIGLVEEKFSRLPSIRKLQVQNCSPYAENIYNFLEVGRKFKENGSDLIILDCMGYTREQRNFLAEKTGVQVVHARYAAAEFAAEMLKLLGAK